MPGATQNEVEIGDAKALVKAGVKLVAEGANMPSNAEAISHFHSNKVEFAPAKAANAGGVAVSGLEMAQNSARLSWTKEEVDEKLKVGCVEAFSRTGLFTQKVLLCRLAEYFHSELTH